MLIINADDYGRSRVATDRILSCHREGSVTSTSAMVFMEDSERAAGLAKDCGIDVGLHLNFSEKLTAATLPAALAEGHHHVAGFLTRHRYSPLLYHPFLGRELQYVWEAQHEEFLSLYGTAPSHFDGHHHLHLCANMLVQGLIPQGRKIRRNFSFAVGERSLLNRTYRALVDTWLGRRYTMPDYLFSLPECLRHGRLGRVLELARTSTVEFETHPEVTEEFTWLTGDACRQAFAGQRRGTYTEL